MKIKLSCGLVMLFLVLCISIGFVYRAIPVITTIEGSYLTILKGTLFGGLIGFVISIVFAMLLSSDVTTTKIFQRFVNIETGEKTDWQHVATKTESPLSREIDAVTAISIFLVALGLLSGFYSTTSIDNWRSKDDDLGFIMFSNNDAGWITTESMYNSHNDHVLFTPDEGITWKEIDFGELSGSIPSIFFIDKQTGWAISNNSVIKTINGGTSWKKQYKLKDSWMVKDIHFTDKSTGWAVGRRVLLHTNDSGKNWEMMRIYGSYLDEGVEVATETHEGTAQDNEYKHTSFEITDYDLRDVYFLDKYHGWAVGDKIVKTTDGGESWSIKKCDVRDPYKIYFIDRSIGWIIGNKIMLTIDGGEEWNIVEADNDRYVLRSVYFTSDQNGFAVGMDRKEIPSHEVILTTDNGGRTWAEIFSSKNQRKVYKIGEKPNHLNIGSLYDIFFSSDKNGYAVGKFGTVIQTKDGGKTWTHPKLKRYYRF